MPRALMHCTARPAAGRPLSRSPAVYVALRHAALLRAVGRRGAAEGEELRLQAARPHFATERLRAIWHAAPCRLKVSGWLVGWFGLVRFGSVRFGLVWFALAGLVWVWFG